MTLSESIASVFSNYAIFSGRARRSEFWLFMLFSALVNVVLVELIYFVDSPTLWTGLYLLWLLGSLIPTMAVTWRRLHDVGRSGVLWFLVIVPVVGWILLVILLAQPGQPGANAYGPAPAAYDYTPGRA